MTGALPFRPRVDHRRRPALLILEQLQSILLRLALGATNVDSARDAFPDFLVGEHFIVPKLDQLDSCLPRASPLEEVSRAYSLEALSAAEELDRPVVLLPLVLDGQPHIGKEDVESDRKSVV